VAVFQKFFPIKFFTHSLLPQPSYMLSPSQPPRKHYANLRTHKIMFSIESVYYHHPIYMLSTTRPFRIHYTKFKNRQNNALR